MMEVENLLSFLITDYGLSYSYQKFLNCFGGKWVVETHSYYNNSGCFTICSMPQRGELDFYFSPTFSHTHEELCKELINVRLIEPEIWDKHLKFYFIRKPFFWWNRKNVLLALSDVMKAHISKHGEVFGIRMS